MPAQKSKKDEQVEKKPDDDGTSRGSITNDSIKDSTINLLKNQGKISNTGRTTTFATVVYPDSAPANWQDIIKDTHVQTLISPLHDKDINPDGTQKKPHYHVMMTFDIKKNFDTQVKPIFDRFKGVGREEVLSARGYARYLCHMDNPEKYQYDASEVTELNGACYQAVITLPTDELGMLEEIIGFIEDQDIYSFRKLFLWCRTNRKDWFHLLATSRTYIIKEYLKSRYWDLENEDRLEQIELINRREDELRRREINMRERESELRKDDES